MPGVKGQVQRRGLERRKAIVDAALELFSRAGSRGTTVAEVADAVGTSPANVLHHFGTKEALLLAVVRERDRRGAATRQEMVAAGGAALLDRLLELAEQSVRERAITAAHIVLLAEGLEPGAAAHEYFLERNRAMRASIADALAADQRRGVVRSDVDCETKAAEILAYLDGAALHWLLDPAPPLVERYRSYLEATRHDLLVPAPAGRGRRTVS